MKVQRGSATRAVSSEVVGKAFRGVCEPGVDEEVGVCRGADAEEEEESRVACTARVSGIDVGANMDDGADLRHGEVQNEARWRFWGDDGKRLLTDTDNSWSAWVRVGATMQTRLPAGSRLTNEEKAKLWAAADKLRSL